MRLVVSAEYLSSACLERTNPWLDHGWMEQKSENWDHEHDRPKRGWVSWPQLHVPVLDWLRDEDDALCPVKLGQPAVVVAVPFKAISSDCHCVLAVQWQAEEVGSVVFHMLYRSLVNSMVCKLQRKKVDQLQDYWSIYYISLK